METTLIESEPITVEPPQVTGPTDRRLTKLKVGKDGKLTIGWQQQSRNNPEVWNDCLMTSDDPPAPGLLLALEALRSVALELCELPASVGDRLKVTGLAVSYGGENGTPGATLTAVRSLKSSSAPLVLNTPHKPYEPYAAGGDESNCLTADHVRLIEAAVTAALAYLDGERAQAQLKL